MFGSRLRRQLDGHLEAIVHKTLTQDERTSLRNPDFLPRILEAISGPLMDDINAFVQRDPASHGCSEWIVDSSSSFCAVMHYRLAHEFWQLRAEPDTDWGSVAFRLSARGKLCSGVDIHPGARIGSGFVLDHAHGIVIGETCQIGDGAYILGGVTLGSLGIANNSPGQRHPTLGNNVQVGAFARVLGPIQVGDDVFISPNCVVKEDIPSDTRVSIVNQIQLAKSESSTTDDAPRIIGSFLEDDRFVVLCRGFRYLTATLLDDSYRQIVSTTVSPTPSDSKRYEIRFPLAPSEALCLLDDPLHISISDGFVALILLNPEGLSGFMSRLASAEAATPALEKASHEYST